MNNEPTPELDEILALVRAHPAATDRAEYAFETRFMARLAEERSASVFTWAWRLCPYFAVLALAAAFWTYTAGAAPSEITLLAAAGHSGEDQALAYFMTGDDTED